MNARTIIVLCLAAAIGLAGCNNTRDAERHYNEPLATNTDTGFGLEQGKDSERKNKKHEPLSDELMPEEAVKALVKQLQSPDRAVSIPAEDELRYWAGKQGVPEIIVREVQPLLHHKSLEVRAPALRLTIAYGKKSSAGDLIEVLADEEYGMRAAAFKFLRSRTGADFGYSPASGDLARAQAIEKFRKWWDEKLHGPKPEDKEAVAEQKPGAPTPVVEKPVPEQTPGPSEVLLPIPKDQQEAQK